MRESSQQCREESKETLVSMLHTSVRSFAREAGHSFAFYFSLASVSFSEQEEHLGVTKGCCLPAWVTNDAATHSTVVLALVLSHGERREVDTANGTL